MSVHRFTLPDPMAAAEACAHHVVTRLEEVLSGNDTVTFAVSGGGTPKLMFDCLAAIKFPWGRVHLFWVDERCVSPTDDQSNYKLTLEHLIRPAHIPPQNVHRVCGELDPLRAAPRYIDDIREFFGLAEGELPR